MLAICVRMRLNVHHSLIAYCINETLVIARYTKNMHYYASELIM